MDLKNMALYLDSVTSLSATGLKKDIFIYQMPNTVSKAVLIRQAEGGDPLDWNLPGYYRTTFQVIVRHSDPEQGMALALQVSEAFTVSGITIGNMKVIHFLPKNRPFVFPVSEGDLLEFSINFDAVFSEIV